MGGNLPSCVYAEDVLSASLQAGGYDPALSHHYGVFTAPVPGWRTSELIDGSMSFSQWAQANPKSIGPNYNTLTSDLPTPTADVFIKYCGAIPGTTGSKCLVSAYSNCYH